MMRRQPNRVLPRKRQKASVDQRHQNGKRQSALHILEHIGIWVAVVALVFQVGWSFFVERPLQREESIVRAWSVLTTPAQGNSGKGRAMSYLASLNISLDGLDLSCRRTEVPRKPTIGCTPQRIYDLDMDYENYASLQFANFEGTEFIDPTIANIFLVDANLQNLLVESGTLSEVQIDSSSIDGLELSYPSVASLSLANSEGNARMRFASLDVLNIWSSRLDSSTFSWFEQAELYVGFSSLRDTWWEANDYRTVDLQASDLSGAQFLCWYEECEDDLLAATVHSWSHPDDPILVGINREDGDVDWQPLEGFRNYCSSSPTVLNLGAIDEDDERWPEDDTFFQNSDIPFLKVENGSCIIYSFEEGEPEMLWSALLEERLSGQTVGE